MMNYILSGYEPKRLFQYFEELSAIPRGSGNEKGVADWLCAFAEKKGLRYRRDELHDVVIWKDATPGYEEKPAVMIQGHTDMVTEKDSGTEHDFEKDGLRLIEKNGWLSADGTTLGGDDGAAVVIMLELLSDDDFPHPALECVFTVQEETGLGGAEHLDVSDLKARKIINIDSEEEGFAVASCAGSLNTHFVLEKDTVPFQNQCMKIKLGGLKGGHSGTDIDAGRQNSILLMGRILTALYEEEPFNLVSLSGGNKRNAIPRECEAVISVLDREKAAETVKKVVAALRPELNKVDKSLKVTAGRTAKATEMYTYKATSAALSFLCLVPNGVLSMSQSKPGLVESSSNLGIVGTSDEGIRFDVYSRSSVEPVTDHIVRTLMRLAKVTGLVYHFDDRGPGWAFTPDTALQKQYLKTYSKLFPDRPAPQVVAIHAGLECGILLDKLGGGDAIAIGPDIIDIHTPSEKMDLHSMERTYKLVKAMLADS